MLHPCHLISIGDSRTGDTMSLSPRAQAYLATLERGEPVPVERVVEALEQVGCPIYDAWLEFHSRFAGYVEVIGRDSGVWGIVHAHPVWLDPWDASVELSGEGWRVVCADIHPSYDYWLSSTGEFISLSGGGSHESFDIKIERNTIFWEAIAGGRSWTIDADLLRAARGIDALRVAVGAEIVKEASDKYATCYTSHDVIVIARPATTEVWVASDAHERVRSQLQSPPA